MHTSTQTKVSKSFALSNVSEKQKSNLWKTAEFNRFGLITVVLLIVGCIGGFAAAYGIEMSSIALAAVVVPAVLTLSLILAVAPMKLILGTATAALLCDLVIFFIQFVG